MRFSTAVVALASIVAVSAQQTFTVVVGGNSTLTYTPDTVNASVGDTVSFQFQTKNHTVTQSTFAAPCQIMTTPAAGVDSGFMPVPAGTTSFPEWSFTVTNASSPLWFYCRQTGHCQQGMVFAINPTAAKSFAAFQAAAKASTPSSSGSPSYGTPAASETTASGSSPSDASSSTPSAKATNGAMRYGSSAASVLAVVGLAAGVLL